MRHREVTASAFGSTQVEHEDVDPMASMANLADVMLVFACGLMLALVVKFNLDITPDKTEVELSDDVSEVPEDIQDGETTMEQSGAGYEELGIVYRDPETGKMYMMKRDTQ